MNVSICFTTCSK